MKDTDVAQLIEDLDGGVFAGKIGHILSELAGAVLDTQKTGDVTIKLSMKQLGNSNQVNCTHQLKYTIPTRNGKRSEENATATPLHVNSGSNLTLFPENQTQMFGKKGEVLSSNK